MWDLPGPGIKPMSPLADGFFTTVPPGKPLSPTFYLTLPALAEITDQRNSE